VIGIDNDRNLFNGRHDVPVDVKEEIGAILTCR
jgi:hypothetical protein